MSREYLSDVLNQFAQLTGIFLETSKIKVYLDEKCNTDSDLNLVLEQTKTQVDNLAKTSATIKDLFYQKYEEVSTQLSSGTHDNKTNEGGEQNGAPSSEVDDPLASDCTPDLTNSQIEAAQTKTIATDKPLIKLVDINKLVEPKTLPKKEFASAPMKENKSVDFDTTVVIITSSDEEPPPLKSSTAAKTDVVSRATRGSRRALKSALKKTRYALQNTSSDSDRLSGKEDISKLRRVKNGNRRKAKLETRNILSETSSSLSENSSGGSSENLVEIVRKENTKLVEEEPVVPLKDDPKFKTECYVNVLRIPCEKLKEYYLEKLELLQIKRLTDLSSLKKKRRRNSGSKKSSGSENEHEKKKAKKTNDDNKSSTDDSDEEPLTNKSKKDECNKDINMSGDESLNITGQMDKEANPNLQEDKTKEADLAMDMLHSDGENKKSSSEAEETDKEEDDAKTKNNKSDKKTEVNDENNKEKPDLSRDKADEHIESKNTEKDQESDKSDKSDQEKNSEDKDKEKIPEDEDKEKENMEKDKKKKSWRKDKLLTMKLSSSDSEEEFEKYSKKKENMQANSVSDDDAEITRTKKKRMVKKRMKKAILSDSDNEDDKKSDDDFQKPSESSSSSESDKEKKQEEEENKKPARKRVKRVKDSSDEDDDEKSTRKQIRNIWGRDSLAETTKKAEAEEKERKARISEKQKKYNQIYESNAEVNAKVEKVVLDFDESNNKELLKLDEELVSKLKPHQASGIQFMWDACFESLERARTTAGSGCILAHCMGLGKTLQVIALTHTLLLNSEQTKVKKVMVVSPLNTVLNWVNEYKQWLPNLDEFDVFELVSFKQNHERAYQVKRWDDYGGVLIIGYDMFRNLSNPENKRISRKLRQIFQKGLVDPGPDLVICDEGHLLKNEKTNLSIAMNRLKTFRRIVLTGTPLQNNLKEYFCMVQFIKPNLLGTYREYLNRFVNPITNGQYTDSTPHDIQVMRRRSHVLHKMLDGVVQRRDYSVLQPYLPPKYEYVLFLNLSEVQIKLYQHYMEHFAKRSTDGSNRTSFLFVDFQALQRICTHPRVLLDKSIEMKNAKEKEFSEDESEGSLKDFINDDEDESSSSDSNSNSGSADENGEGGGEKKNTATRKRVTRAQAALANENNENNENEPILVENVEQKEWWQEYCDGDELNVIAHSSKIFLLFEILKECEQIGDKVLVFSQSLYSLNVIEYFLGRVHDATQLDQMDTVGGYSGSWCLGLDYFRLDGSSSCDSRTSWCKTFNDPSNTRARLFLISTKAGGLGINLVAANRVIIFDVSWNPSHDVQSIYRVYRFGQTKPCYIYRFVTNGTMEMKIYERQVTKQAISKRVIDEQQIDRHYNQNDLAELYKFDPHPENRPIPLVPKDVLLGELLQRFEERIYKYHEHQSLLENKEDEGLNEEERKAAWEEFENEKKQRYNIGTNMFRTVHIEAALMNIVRKENPTWNETQVRAMIPALQVQLQDTVAKGDLGFYRRVMQEAQILQALQNQKLKEQYYHQQAMRLFQQQQMANALRGQQPGRFLEQYLNQIPGSSRGFGTVPNMLLNSNEIIDLND